jgi:hypothetical protein
MIPVPASPQPHCEHECRCWIDRIAILGEIPPCHIGGCKDDTRTRPHTPAPEVIAYPLTDVDIEELSDYANAEDAEACIRSLCERIKKRPTDTAFGYVNICNQDKCIKQRDQIARTATLAENKRVLDKAIEQMKIRVYGAKDGKIERGLNTAIGVCESLRQQEYSATVGDGK